MRRLRHLEDRIARVEDQLGDDAAVKALRAEAKPERTEYTPELGQEIAELIAAGTPMDDATISDTVVKLGICSQVGVSARTCTAGRKSIQSLPRL